MELLNIPTPVKMTPCPPRLQTLCMRGILTIKIDKSSKVIRQDPLSFHPDSISMFYGEPYFGQEDIVRVIDCGRAHISLSFIDSS